MAWPWRRKSRRKLARIAIEGPIAGPTRERVLKALREVEQRECPALLLRIDSPGGTVGDSQEIHGALLRLKQKGCKVVASFSNLSGRGKSEPLSQLVTDCAVTPSASARSFCFHPRACSDCLMFSLWITFCIGGELCITNLINQL